VRRTRPFSLIRNASRAWRHSSSALAAARGDSTSRGRSLLSGGAGSASTSR